MDGAAINAIVAQVGKPTILDAHGKKILVRPGADGWAKEDLGGPGPAPTPLALTTLTGLVDYLEANPDGLAKDGLIVHVASPTSVVLLTSLESKADAPAGSVWSLVNRWSHAVANYAPPNAGLGDFMDSERFVILLQALFFRTDDREKVLGLVGNLKEEAVRQTEDDGITQTVTARAGLVTSAAVQVPNPVQLAPYRTFTEVAQPISKFILRLRSAGAGERPQCGLFEADGGAWKAEAIQTVKDYLVGKLPGVTILA